MTPPRNERDNPPQNPNTSSRSPVVLVNSQPGQRRNRRGTQGVIAVDLTLFPATTNLASTALGAECCPYKASNPCSSLAHIHLGDGDFDIRGLAMNTTAITAKRIIMLLSVPAPTQRDHQPAGGGHSCKLRQGRVGTKIDRFTSMAT